jgi:hypothetical protein
MIRRGISTGAGRASAVRAAGTRILLSDDRLIDTAKALTVRAWISTLEQDIRSLACFSLH